MTTAVRHAATVVREAIVDGWVLCATPPGMCGAPPEVDHWAAERWITATHPGTVAAMLRAVGVWRLDDAPRRLDAEDWWYRASFELSAADVAAALRLGFDGLAGAVEVWLNGHRLLQTDNMFIAHEHAIKGVALVGRNTLHLRFASLDAALAARRARPRWRAPMIEHQQLRWHRTTLLGRTPGWSPPAPAIGLWKDVWLERRRGARVQVLDLRVGVTAAGVGEVSLTCAIQLGAGQTVDHLMLEIEHAGALHRAALSRRSGSDADFEGRLQVRDPVFWWPHTHGDPALYTAHLIVGATGEDAPIKLPLHAIGFRTITLDSAGGRFAISVNGVPVFCRGACWMPLDVVSLRTTPHEYRVAVAQVRSAGMNMLRVSGATVYEDDAFFDACDEAGVLVWQDFMFANMDYPAADADFCASVTLEEDQQLERWRARPSLAIVCGNSEAEQQAAMWGAPRALWCQPLFHEVLRARAQAALPDVPYWPSSTHGGAFPHQSDVGTSSYYGVGAYRRPVQDARRAAVAFATECLAFANVPEASTLARMPGGHALRVHHPVWKLRAPRDLGVGWDFEDVRDHYLSELFGVDAPRCRDIDHDRYLAMSRVVTGEVMASAFAEWRRPGSGCAGALVWFQRDLWAGAGWGLVDDVGVPKACWHYLRRALQPLAVFITDEGCNGLVAHVVNERAEALEGELRIALFNQGEVLVGNAAQPVHVAGRGACSVALAGCFDGFMDLSNTYRFGPAPATLVHVCLCLQDGVEVSEAFFFPTGLAATASTDIGLEARIETAPDGARFVELQTRSFAQSVQIQVDGHLADDNYFHMAPQSQRRVALQPVSGPRQTSCAGTVSALNSMRSIPIRFPS